jgi:hypothetical protein
VVPRTVFEKSIFWLRLISLVGLLIYIPSAYLELFDNWDIMLKLEKCSNVTQILAFLYILFSISLLFSYFLIQKLPSIGFVLGFLFRFFSPLIIFKLFPFLFYNPLFMVMNDFKLWNECTVQYDEYRHEFGFSPYSHFLALCMDYLLVFIILEFSVAATRITFYSGEPT